MDVFEFGIVTLLLLAPSSQADIPSQQQIAKFEAIEYSREYSEFYRKLYSASDPVQVEALTRQQNDSIAIQSAWELVKADVTATSNNRNWFLGYFEGRASIALPKWWRRLILDACVIDMPGPSDTTIKTLSLGKLNQRIYHAPALKRSGIYCLKKVGTFERKCPKNASINEQNGVLTYSDKKNSIAIPKKLLELANGELAVNGNICCSFTDRLCFIAIHSDFGSRHLVACVERKSNEIVWHSAACGCSGALSGFHESWVSLMPTDDGRLFCFGYASVGIYAHGFDVSNGKTLVQFSSTY